MALSPAGMAMAEFFSIPPFFGLFTEELGSSSCLKNGCFAKTLITVGRLFQDINLAGLSTLALNGSTPTFVVLLAVPLVLRTIKSLTSEGSCIHLAVDAIDMVLNITAKVINIIVLSIFAASLHPVVACFVVGAFTGWCAFRIVKTYVLPAKPAPAVAS